MPACYDSEGSDRGSLYSSIIRYSIVVLGYRNGEIPGDYSPRTFKLPRLQALIDSKKPFLDRKGFVRTPEGIRTPNLLIRSQTLYPLSYRRMLLATGLITTRRSNKQYYTGTLDSAQVEKEC